MPKRVKAPAVMVAIEWAGGVKEVAKLLDMTESGVRKWIQQEASGQWPLRVTEYWRVVKLAEVSEVPIWRLTGSPRPREPQAKVTAPLRLVEKKAPEEGET